MLKDPASLVEVHNDYMYSLGTGQTVVVTAAAEGRRRGVHIELDAAPAGGIWSKWVLSHLVVIVALFH